MSLRVLVAAVASALVIPVLPAVAAPDGGSQTGQAVRHAVSAPLRTIARDRATPQAAAPVGSLRRPTPQNRLDDMLANAIPGVAVTGDTGPVGDASMPAATGFAGVSNVNGYYPPDTDGVIGPNHYLQIVNSSFAVFDRQGNKLLGPLDNNTIWQNLGGDCAQYNDGDPIVQYDQFADRWLVTQFAVEGGLMGGSYYECVAVSQTPNPTGAYNLYAFAYDEFPDYPKVGVWPDGYYVSYNMFDDLGDFTGAKVCAWERAAMLAGAANPREVCFQKPAEWALLPSDVDGPTPPPAGSPNYVLGESWDSPSHLTMYKFAVNWANPPASSFSGPISVPVNPFAWACADVSRGRCVPQPETGVLLESLGSRLMYRLAYRNFGDHESLVANHTVAMDGELGLTAQTGIKWYELRDLQQAVPTVYQDGVTADPDGQTFRFMGSIAQDRVGNMALGYSSSSATQYPSIEYVGRGVLDPPSTMTQAAGTLKAGTGSQTGAAARWGDYSSMSVDPVDDCTFWYTNEYLEQTSWNSWKTWISSFKYPGCGTRPSAARSVSARQSGPRAIEVAWAPALEDGFLPPLSYVATASPSGKQCQSSGTSCTIPNLQAGTTYTVSVVSRNSLGDGPAATSGALSLPKLQQSGTALVAKRIKAKGKTVLLRKRVTTDAGQIASAKVKVTPTKKKYSRVLKKSSGRIVIKTYGKKRLQVRLKLRAPATTEYTSYSFTKTWRVRRSR